MVPRCLISSTSPAAPTGPVAPRKAALAIAARASHRPYRLMMLSPLKVLKGIESVVFRRAPAPVCLLPALVAVPSIPARLDSLQASYAGARDQREDQVQSGDAGEHHDALEGRRVELAPGIGQLVNADRRRDRRVEQEPDEVVQERREDR